MTDLDINSATIKRCSLDFSVCDNLISQGPGAYISVMSIGIHLRAVVILLILRERTCVCHLNRLCECSLLHRHICHKIY